MAWWWWVLIWVALVVAAGVLVALIGLSLWRKGLALARELSDAAERFAVISAELERLTPPAPEPAVFDDAARLRAEREKILRLARARTDLRMRQRAELRPVFPPARLPAKAQPGAPAPVSGHRVP